MGREENPSLAKTLSIDGLAMIVALNQNRVSLHQAQGGGFTSCVIQRCLVPPPPTMKKVERGEAEPQAHDSYPMVSRLIALGKVVICVYWRRQFTNQLEEGN